LTDNKKFGFLEDIAETGSGEEKSAENPVEKPAQKEEKAASKENETSEPVEKKEGCKIDDSEDGIPGEKGARPNSARPSLDEEDEEEEQDTIFDKIRNKPALVILPIVGLGMILYMVIHLVNVWSNVGEASKESQRPEYPEIESPKVRKEPYSRDELNSLMRAAEKKVKADRSGTVAAGTNDQGKVLTSKSAIDAEVERKLREKLAALRAGNKSRGRGHAQEPRTQKAGRRSGRAVVKQPPSEEQAEKPHPQNAGAAPFEEGAPKDMVGMHGTAGAEPVAQRRARSADFYQAGVTIKSEGSKKPGKTTSSIPAGTTFGARLMVGINSDFSSAIVLAKATQAVKVGGKVVIPRGSTLKGRMRSSEKKIFLDFNQAILPSGGSVSFRGYAVKKKVPGIPAKIIKTGGSKSSAVGRGALKTASGVVGGITGNIGAQLAGNVAAEGISDAQETTQGGYSRNTLELKAGTKFQVVVTGE